MIFLHIVLAIILLSFTGGFIKAQFDSNVSDDSCIGLGIGTFVSLALFWLSFLS